MSKKTLELLVERVLKEYDYLSFDEKEKMYYSTIYPDRGDALQAEDIKNILSSDDPRQCLSEKLFEYYSESEIHYFNEVMNKLSDAVEENLDHDYEFDLMEETLREKFYIEYPQGYFLKQEVLVNICMYNYEEANHEHTLNNFGHSYFRMYGDIDDEHVKNSSIIKLTKSQGYTKKDLKNAIEKGGEKKFLTSVVQELENVTSSMNRVTILRRYSLGELIEIMKKKSNIVITPEDTIGLVDFDQGAGGVLGISLEKNISLNHDEYTISVDGQVGYSIENIYGLCKSAWTKTRG